MILTQTCTSNDHPNRVTYTRCRIDTISSPDESQANLHIKRSSTESDNIPDVVLIQLVLLMSLTQTCTPNDHLQGVTYQMLY